MRLAATNVNTSTPQVAFTTTHVGASDDKISQIDTKLWHTLRIMKSYFQWVTHCLAALTAYIIMFNIRVRNATDHYSDVIIRSMASQITNLTIVYPTVYSGADQRKHKSSASLAFVRGIHQWPVNSPHKRPVTRKMFPFDDVIMQALQCQSSPDHRISNPVLSAGKSVWRAWRMFFFGAEKKNGWVSETLSYFRIPHKVTSKARPGFHFHVKMLSSGYSKWH